MYCCLCGREIDYKEYYIKLTLHRVETSLSTGEVIHSQHPFEDGYTNKIACALCPSVFGAPLALTGMGGGRQDV